MVPDSVNTLNKQHLLIYALSCCVLFVPAATRAAVMRTTSKQLLYCPTRC